MSEPASSFKNYGIAGASLGTVLSIIGVVWGISNEFGQFRARIDSLEKTVARLPSSIPPPEVVSRLSTIEERIMNIRREVDEMHKDIRDHMTASDRMKKSAIGDSVVR